MDCGVLGLVWDFEDSPLMDIVCVVSFFTWSISPKPKILASEVYTDPASTWMRQGLAVAGQVGVSGSFSRTEVACAHSLLLGDICTKVDYLKCDSCPNFG